MRRFFLGFLFLSHGFHCVSCGFGVCTFPMVFYTLCLSYSFPSKSPECFLPTCLGNDTLEHARMVCVSFLAVCVSDGALGLKAESVPWVPKGMVFLARCFSYCFQCVAFDSMTFQCFPMVFFIFRLVFAAFLIVFNVSPMVSPWFSKFLLHSFLSFSFHAAPHNTSDAQVELFLYFSIVFP